MGAPKIARGGERVERIIVTAELAREWRQKSLALSEQGLAPPPRKINKNYLSGYARDMENGHWGQSSTLVAITRSGYIANGNHRLEAVILSGCAVEMLVMFDCDEDIVLNEDMGNKRSYKDNLHMGGGETPTRGSENLLLSVLQMPRGRDWHPTPFEYSKAYSLVREELEWITSLSKDLRSQFQNDSSYSATLKQVVFKAVMVRAALNGFRAEAEGFCRAVASGEPGTPLNYCRAMDSWRNSIKTYTGSANRKEFYIKTCRALVAFLGRAKPLQRFMGNTSGWEDPFPLPRRLTADGLQGVVR